MTLIMDGKSVAKETEEALKKRVEGIKQEKGFVPTLATILVGNDPASATYVKMKGNACERVGMKSLKVELPETTTTEELLDKIIDLKQIIIQTLDINKAQDIISIDLKDKSSMADHMIIASGTSSRHIQSLSEQVLNKFKDKGIKNSKIEGKESSEWKLVDGIDIIVHIFHPEKRKFYELEKMWSELIPKEKLII